MKEKISQALENLSTLCLYENEFQDYTEEDLFNATLIFSHILLDNIWRTNQESRQSTREELATYTGNAIRELIGSVTYIDMHDVAKNKPKK
jgi:hypothetical protein